MENGKALGPSRDKDLWQRLVNDKFEGKSPVLPPDESVKAAKRLYRKAMGEPWRGPVKLTSGRRYTWIRRGVLYVNPDGPGRGGLREIIHTISHYAHMRLHPNDAPHSKRQARLEGRLATYAIRSGFLDGALRSKAKPKPKPDLVQRRYEAILRREEKWAAELERATRLLSRAQKDRAQYERRHGDRLKN